MKKITFTHILIASLAFPFGAIGQQPVIPASANQQPAAMIHHDEATPPPSAPKSDDPPGFPVVLEITPPVIVCISGGLSSNIGPTGNAPALFVVDFILYAYDNSTPNSQLKFGIRRGGTGTGFPYADSTQTIGQQYILVGCDDIPEGQTQQIIPIEVWVKDIAGNTAKCETTLLLNNPNDYCNHVPSGTPLAIIRTEALGGVGYCNFTFTGPSFPPPNITYITGGTYLIDPPLPSGTITVQPYYNQDPTNGITSYDLLLISRHILGIETLNTTYKLISADFNRSGTITSFDIIEIRKLILGIYVELPDNISWRFVRTAQVFTNPQNPFLDSLQESYTQISPDLPVEEKTFVAIKMGDVDNSAQPDGFTQSDDRTNQSAILEARVAGHQSDLDVEMGSERTVDFRFDQVPLAWQFTLETDGLEVVEILPKSEGLTTDHFGVFEDALTAVGMETAGAFSVRFRARQPGRLDDMLRITNRITQAVGYTESGESMDLQLRFDSDKPLDINPLDVRQNTPNPWLTETTIYFNVKEQDHVTLEVYDATGRLLHTQAGDFARGRNAFVLRRSQVPGATDTMYYTVTTSTGRVTKPMQVIWTN
jgi:hypothetical protein